MPRPPHIHTTRTWHGASIAARAFGLLLGLAAEAHAADLGNIWTVGDSFTSGFTVPGGYRPALYDDLTAAGDTFRFVGSITTDSTPLLDATGQNHQDGHSGALIAEGTLPNGASRFGIYENIADYYQVVASTQGRPGTILLMIGLNDLNNNVDPAGAPGRLDLLITRILGLAPSAHLFVASVNPARQGNLYMDPSVTDLAASTLAYNASIPGIVSAHDALGQNVSFVDIYGALSLADIGADGLHPTAAGYATIANTFAAALLVPEPSTWALMLLGVGAVGFRARRQRAT